MNVRMGSVLILTLWTLFFLSALAIAVSAHVDSGLRFAGWFKNGTSAYYLAVAGVEKGIMEVMSDTNTWDGMSESWGKQDAFKNVELGGGVYSVTHEVITGAGSAVTNYGLIDEESRININKATPQVLAALIVTACGVDQGTALDIADAVVDWRDPNDDVLTGGAENNYYQALGQPIKCHNADFQSVYELLLVKGITPDLFAKLEPHVTLYGSGKVNLNTAGFLVLKSLAFSCGGDAATCASLAEKIVRFREAGNDLRTATGPDITRQLRESAGLQQGSAEDNLLAPMMLLITLQSTCFGGTAEGEAGMGDKNQNSEVVKRGEICRIDFIYDRHRRTKVYWHEK